ncbi:MAG: Fic family protein [Wenzhouxiangellaceae bacterium]
MDDWDADSTQLYNNLRGLLSSLRDAAQARAIPDSDDFKEWHRRMLHGLAAPDKHLIGAFRGERGLETLEVRVGRNRGAAARDVANASAQFEQRLASHLHYLDAQLKSGHDHTTDELLAVVDLCAWVHAEWVRVHPFANGNGRIARLLANFVAMRYGLPPFIRLRPRPDMGYSTASQSAMSGDWQPTARVFEKMLITFLNQNP